MTIDAYLDQLGEEYYYDQYPNNISDELARLLATPEEKDQLGVEASAPHIDEIAPAASGLTHLSSSSRSRLSENYRVLTEKISQQFGDQFGQICLHIGPSQSPYDADLDVVVHDAPARALGEITSPGTTTERGTTVYEPLEAGEGQLTVSGDGYPCAQFVRREGLVLFILPTTLFRLSGRFRTAIRRASDIFSRERFEQALLSGRPFSETELAARSAADRLNDSWNTPDFLQAYQKVADRVEECERELENQISSLRTLKDQREQVEVRSESGDRAERLRGQIERIRNHTKVDFVRYNDRGENQLWVYTEHLVVEDDRTGTYHDLGRFEIVIDVTDISEKSVRMYNQTRKIDGHEEGCQAPHVFRRGNMCAGNFEQMLPSLLAQEQYATAVSECIRFLENANTHDTAGRYVEEWPSASEDLLESYREEHGSLP